MSSLTPGVYDFTLYQGRDFSDTFTATNPDGTPYNLTNKTLVGIIVDNYVDCNLVCSISAASTVAVSGQWLLAIPALSTVQIPTKQCINKSQREDNLGVYQIDIVDNLTGLINPLLVGKVRLCRSTKGIPPTT